MNVEDLALRYGRVVHWDLDPLVPDKPIREHDRWDLKEDLALVTFPGGIVLDVGWYPEFSPDGAFTIVVIRTDASDAEGDGGAAGWGEPILRRDCATIPELAIGLREAVVFAERLARRGPEEGPVSDVTCRLCNRIVTDEAQVEADTARFAGYNIMSLQYAQEQTTASHEIDPASYVCRSCREAPGP